MMSDATYEATDVRASDAEREEVIGRLEREFAAGRLTVPELEQRIAAAHQARTREHLLTLTLDLPSARVLARTATAGPDRCLLCWLFCACAPRLRRLPVHRPGGAW